MHPGQRKKTFADATFPPARRGPVHLSWCICLGALSLQKQEGGPENPCPLLQEAVYCGVASLPQFTPGWPSLLADGWHLKSHISQTRLVWGLKGRCHAVPLVMEVSITNVIVPTADVCQSRDKTPYSWGLGEEQQDLISSLNPQHKEQQLWQPSREH